MKEAIVVKDLTKTFSTKVKKPGFVGAFTSLFSSERKEPIAVDHISFSINQGELVGFIGPNGAGKSTTIKMLTGILFPTSGDITVLGRNPQNERVKLAYEIGTIFGQRQQLWLHLPPIDSFNLFAKIYEIPDASYKARLKELVTLFELTPYLNTPVRKLSLGERMRCEFVASLLHDPKVLFLDEPTIGLDIIAKQNMRDYIRKLNKTGTTVILTSHDLDDIEELCPRVIVINHGKILYDGSMDTLRGKLKTKVLELRSDEEFKQLPALTNVRVVKKEKFAITLEVDRTKVPIRKVLDTYLKKFHVIDIVIEDPPIEDIIRRLYR